MVESIKDLAPNPKNPRVISDDRLQLLRKAIHEHGDLSGIVYNRKTQTLVSGHQRSKVFGPDAEIHIEQTYKKPTRTGTVAQGFVLLDGERYSYREVLWDGAKEKAASLAANRNAGDWDNALLADWLHELDDFGVDSDLTMFSKAERDGIFESLLPKEKKQKTEKSRVASDDVLQLSLTFTKENHSQFQSDIEYFQKVFQIDNVTDTVMNVLRAARESHEAGLEDDTVFS
jgi:hypothetical protein